MRAKFNHLGTKLLARRRRTKPARKRYRHARRQLIEHERREDRRNLSLMSGGDQLIIKSATQMPENWLKNIAEGVFQDKPTERDMKLLLSQPNHALFLALDLVTNTVIGQIYGIVENQPNNCCAVRVDKIGTELSFYSHFIERRLVTALMLWGRQKHGAGILASSATQLSARSIFLR